MKKPVRRKHVPPWVTAAALAVIVVILIVVWFTRFERRGQIKLTRQNIAEMQAFINAGGVPMLGRAGLERLGIKFPPDYEQRVARRQAEGGGRFVPGPAEVGTRGR